MKELPKFIVQAKLWCPHCGARHIDEERNGEKWHRRAHTTHRCQSCGGDFDVFVSGAQDDEVRAPRPMCNGEHPTPECGSDQCWQRQTVEAPDRRRPWSKPVTPPSTKLPGPGEHG